MKGSEFEIPINYTSADKYDLFEVFFGDRTRGTFCKTHKVVSEVLNIIRKSPWQ